MPNDLNAVVILRPNVAKHDDFTASDHQFKLGTRNNSVNTPSLNLTFLSHSQLYAHIDRSRIALDVGFSDAITPAPHLQDFSTLLATEAITVLTVTFETVIAEKFQAMIALEARNTCLKDFYDLHRIAVSANTNTLRVALERTFEQHETSFAAALEYLMQDVAAELSRQRLCETYLKRMGREAPDRFTNLMSTIGDLLEPIVSGVAEGERWPQQQRWN